MSYSRILISILIMAAVTYLPRVLPLVIFKKKINNRFIQLYLTYIPYAVLAAMIFPDAFSSTTSLISASIGLVAAILLAYWGKGLITVALGATAVVFIVERLLPMI